MTHRVHSARLFVAVDPPVSVADQLQTWARAAAAQIRRERRSSHQPIRVLDAELLHVTVLFLGERPLEQIFELTEQLRACARPSVDLSVGAPLWLPPRRPRALAVELHDENNALSRLHAEVEARLEWTPMPVTAEPPARSRVKRFRPHITVARMRSQAGGARSRTGSTEQESLPPTPPLSFRPAELTLYRSWLSPEGASYEPVASFALGDSD